MARWLKKTYEQLFEDGSGQMKVSRGKVHDYLGMTLDFTVLGEVKITMFDYIESMVKDWLAYDDTSTTSTTPAAEHLFRVDPDATRLAEKEAKVFHNFVARALFLTKRARPDIHTAVAFTTTRVREPNRDDWKKLVRMMRYLRGTPELPLICRADGTNIVKWWVNASHAVHPNMRGHTGGTLSLGKGSMVNASTK